MEVIKLRNISFGNGHWNTESYDSRFEIFKATILKSDDVTTEDGSFLSLLKCQLEEETMQRVMNAFAKIAFNSLVCYASHIPEFAGGI